MKFLHVTDVAYPHIGGVEYVVLRYSSMQRREGHRSYVITTRLPGTERRENVEGVEYIRLSKLGMATSILGEIRRMEPDLIHTHSYLSALTLSYLHRIRRDLPIIRHIHDVYMGKYEDYSGWEGAGAYEHLEKFAVKRDFTAYITPSQYTKSRLVELGIEERRIHVVHPGVDVERFGRSDGNYVRGRYKIPERMKIVGFVGRLSTGKGPQYLIEALKNVDDAFIVLVGPNPDPKTSGILGIEDRLRKMVSEYGMENRVVFAGKIRDEEVPLFYDSFDIFCLPSISEGFGMSIAEALASGKPVVSFRTTAIPEIVKHGFNGLLAEPRNVEDLREKLVALLRDENLYDKLMKNARKSVEEFTWENSYRRLMQVYSLYL